MVKVGSKAPLFKTKAYHQDGFKDIELEEVLAEEKWVVLCFYPGDFTFV